jgi:initiation factor 1A
MVYNVGGGNKSKGLARKFVVQSHANNNNNGAGKTVRTVKEDGEQYAIVQKHLGNCMCAVMCSDGYRRLCIIRKKFTGRRKTDNHISSGSVVLVGLHDYSGGSGGAGDVKRCDLLYVYSEQEKEKLRKVCDLSKLSSSLDDAATATATASQSLPGQPDADCNVAFITSGTGVFNKYAKDESRRQQQQEQLQQRQSQALVKNVISGSDWLDNLPPEDEEEDGQEPGSDSSSAASASSEQEQEPEEECPVMSKKTNSQKTVIDIDDI